MPFEKGKPKTGGRKAGAKNKVTQDIKTRIADLINHEFDKAQDNLGKLDPKEHVTAYLKFLEYVLPKQKETKLDVTARLDSMSDEQLNALIDHVLNSPTL